MYKTTLSITGNPIPILTLALLLALATAFILALPTQAQADTRYVTEGGTGDGTSWATASSIPQTMIDAVKGTGGGEVWIAAGTYTPESVRSSSFQMENGVVIYGWSPNSGSPAWVDRDWYTNTTVLSGDIGTQGDMQTIVTMLSTIRVAAR